VSTSSDEWKAAFERQRAHRWRMAETTAAERIARLRRLEAAILSRRDAIAEALHADLRRPHFEAEYTEIEPSLGELRHAVRHLPRWMKPRRVRTPAMLVGTRSEIRWQPRGVVLVLAPWNYPVALVLMPLVAAVAAGNCVMVKPSEKAPRSVQLLDALIRDAFPSEEVSLVRGGPEVARGLLELPFDHIFFTGGARLAREVMAAAARHLTPVTLELGGKSPVVVDETADIPRAARGIAWARFLNAGQTCLAADYVLVHRSRESALVAELARAVERFYGAAPGAREASADYARLADDAAFARVSGLLEQAVREGARVEIGGETAAADRYIAPTILSGVHPDSALMQEEIFGPLLPVLAYDEPDELLARLRAGGAPLTMAVFSKRPAAARALLDRTVSGGASVNTVMLHYGNAWLPFGGIGASGMGAYHGEFGFRTLSHGRAILQQGRLDLTRVLQPPYRPGRTRLLRMVRRLFG
jgi:aldehyde dehydrogenase (NAD+)